MTTPKVKERDTTKSSTFTIPEDPQAKSAFMTGWDLLRISYRGKVVAVYKYDWIRAQAYHPNRKVLVSKEDNKEYIIIKMINAKW